MGTSRDPVVGLARLSALALTAADLVYAGLMQFRPAAAQRIFGESSGAWHDWGIGLLLSAAAIQSVPVARPTAAALARYGILRSTVAAGHVGAIAFDPPHRRRAGGLLLMNLTATALGLAASRRVAT